MHACQIGPTDTAPPCPGSPQRASVETEGEIFETYTKKTMLTAHDREKAIFMAVIYGVNRLLQV